MKSLSILIAACALLAAPAARAAEAQVSAPIPGMMAGFHKGDVAAVKALPVASQTITWSWASPAAKPVK